MRTSRMGCSLSVAALASKGKLGATLIRVVVLHQVLNCGELERCLDSTFAEQRGELELADKVALIVTFIG